MKRIIGTTRILSSVTRKGSFFLFPIHRPCEIASLASSPFFFLIPISIPHGRWTDSQSFINPPSIIKNHDPGMSHFVLFILLKIRLVPLLTIFCPFLTQFPFLFFFFLFSFFLILLRALRLWNIGNLLLRRCDPGPPCISPPPQSFCGPPTLSPGGQELPTALQRWTPTRKLPVNFIPPVRSLKDRG